MAIKIRGIYKVRKLTTLTLCIATYNSNKKYFKIHLKFCQVFLNIKPCFVLPIQRLL